jgi:hydrogenase 3 maturation protease
MYMAPGTSPAQGRSERSPWEEQLVQQVRGGFVLLGVGSRLKADDAAGPMVAEKLAERDLERAFDCGTVPENYLAKAEKLQPDNILFVDAADFGGEPGDVRFFGGDRFGDQAVSTHSAGLSPLVEYLENASDARCWVLSIQPARTDYGGDVSPEVARAVESIAESDVWFELD